ncbi:MAG TPA: RDD family protein [Chloroflexota bacterium]|nr:RDD family protein [Chloroflexota bacterium]
MAAGETGPSGRYQLVVQQGPRAGDVIVLDRPRLRLGRQGDNDIILPDREVSRHHARLEQQGDLLLITDEGSSNGTFVNGARVVAPTPLYPGDVVEVGASRLLVQGGPAREAAWPDQPELPSVAPSGKVPAAAERPSDWLGRPLAPWAPSPLAESPAAPAEPEAHAPSAAPAAPPVAATDGPPALPARASFWPRLAASLIDALILLALVGLTRFIVGTAIVRVGLLLGGRPRELGEAAALLSTLASVALVVVYLLGCWALAGATPGKHLLGLRIVNRAGQAPSLGQAVVRALGYLLSALVLGLGFLWLFGPERRGWHDRLAGTYVVKRQTARADTAVDHAA